MDQTLNRRFYYVDPLLVHVEVIKTDANHRDLTASWTGLSRPGEFVRIGKTPSGVLRLSRSTLCTFTRKAGTITSSRRRQFEVFTRGDGGKIYEIHG